MDYLIVCTTALVAAGLTLFSGFGLGTLLLPALALYFPVELAVAATAVVHLANNLLKVALMRRWADWGVSLRFGIPAAVTAFVGAWLLSKAAVAPPLLTYGFFGREARVTPVGLLVGGLILVFAVVEALPVSERAAAGQRWVPLGGALSGFFGGLSGHQGALRSAFLLRVGLDKKQLLGTFAVCAVIVDVSRFAGYGVTFLGEGLAAMRERGAVGLVAAAAVCALAGSVAGFLLVEKVTLGAVKVVITVALVVFGVAMVAGVV